MGYFPNMEHDKINQTLGEIKQWQKDHAIEDKEFQAKMEEILKELPKKGDFEKIVKDALFENLLGLGKATKITLITLAMIIGAIAVIGGGLKWLIGLFGFTITR